MSDIFQRYCKSTGKIALVPDDFPPDGRMEFERAVAEFRGFSAAHAAARGIDDFQLHVGFIASDQFNAVASTKEAEPVVGINWQVVLTLRSFFDEVAQAPALSWIAADDRERASLWLYQISLHSIFLHEFCHIWNGHTRAVETRNIPFIDELNAFPTEKMGTIERRTLEFDADCFSGTNVINYSQYLAFPFINQNWEQFGNGVTSLAMAAFAMHLVFRRFDKAADFDFNTERVHPSAPLRSRIIAATMARQAEDRFNFVSALEMILWGINLAEIAYAQTRSQEVDDSALQATLDPDQWQPYLARLATSWASLHAELDALKFGGTIAPIELPNR